MCLYITRPGVLSNPMHTLYNNHSISMQRQFNALLEAKRNLSSTPVVFLQNNNKQQQYSAFRLHRCSSRLSRPLLLPFSSTLPTNTPPLGLGGRAIVAPSSRVRIVLFL